MSKKLSDEDKLCRNCIFCKKIDHIFRCTRTVPKRFYTYKNDLVSGTEIDILVAENYWSEYCIPERNSRYGFLSGTCGRSGRFYKTS